MSELPRESTGKGFFRLSLAFFVVSLMMIGVVTWFFMNQITPMLDPVQRLKGALETITKNEVKQSGHSLEIQTNAIEELATVEREMHSIIKYEGTFLGQKKMLILKGTFRATAGFDLTKAPSFSIIENQVSDSPMTAEILHVELLDYEIYHSQDSAFNKLTPEDQEIATNQLLEQARQDAIESDLRTEAQLKFHERLDDFMRAPRL